MSEILELFNSLHKVADQGNLSEVHEKLFELQRLIIPPQPSFGARSPKWSKFRDKCVKEHPFCAACNGTKELQAHHIKPFHIYPELELEKKNIIILCMAPSHYCHFVLGHAFRWDDWNPKVELSAKMLLKVVLHRAEV